MTAGYPTKATRNIITAHESKARKKNFQDVKSKEKPSNLSDQINRSCVRKNLKGYASTRWSISADLSS